MRMVCLVCCCITKDLGSASHLNALKEEEIEMFQQQLELELQRRGAQGEDG